MKQSLLALLVTAPLLGLLLNPPNVTGDTHKPDVIYGRKDGLALTLDVFTPTKPNGAGVVFLQNGAWRKAHDQPSFFEELTKRGYVVFAVVVGGQPKFTIPEEAVDVTRAVRFVRHHAKEYGVQPDRLGIVGASSGGHLALLHAMTGDNGNAQATDPIEKTPSKIQAVACFFPPTDFLNYGEKGKVQSGGNPLNLQAAFDFHEWDEKQRLFVRVADEAKKREILRQVSPITHVKKDSPPTFIMHGDKDVVVPLQQSETFIARLKEAGVPAKLVVKPGGAHPWPDFWRQDMFAMANWFDEYLKGK